MAAVKPLKGQSRHCLHGAVWQTAIRSLPHLSRYLSLVEAVGPLKQAVICATSAGRFVCSRIDELPARVMW